jgi:hypothetical protein
MSLNCDVIIVNSEIANASKTNTTIFIVIFKFLIAVGVFVSDNARCKAFLDFIFFLKPSNY